MAPLGKWVTSSYCTGELPRASPLRAPPLEGAPGGKKRKVFNNILKLIFKGATFRGRPGGEKKVFNNILKLIIREI